MITSPITTLIFRNSVLNLASTYYQTADSARDSDKLPIPLVPALIPEHSTLGPNDTISQLLMTTASWIDLASPDPVIANLSRQVFNLEVAYAAFCGVQHVIVHGPDLRKGSVVQQFARAIQEAIGIGPYIQFHILMPMGASRMKTAIPGQVLADYARIGGESREDTVSEWSSWEAWNAMRQFCNYSGRLTLGKLCPRVTA